MIKKWPFISHRFLEFFLWKLKKSGNRKICVLCCCFWSNQDLDMFSTSEWPSAIKFFGRYLCSWQKMTRNYPKMAKLKRCIFYIESEYIFIVWDCKAYLFFIYVWYVLEWPRLWSFKMIYLWNSGFAKFLGPRSI